MNLNLLIIIPVLTAIAILFCGKPNQVRITALTGAAIELLLSLFCLSRFLAAREAGNNQIMLFEQDHPWFPALNIHYHIGVDGISMAMILLTAVVVLAGVLVSWAQESLSKEFFFLLLFLSDVGLLHPFTSPINRTDSASTTASPPRA